MRVLVCGGRDYDDETRAFDVLDSLRAIHGELVIINGGAAGADTLARAWARDTRSKCITINAEWTRYGKAAGPVRNQAMLDEEPDLVVAFPGGRGTQDMVSRARVAGIKIIEIEAQF